MSERLVRRRLNGDNTLTGVLSESEVELQGLELNEVSTLCGRLLGEFRCLWTESLSYSADDSHSDQHVQDSLNGHVASLCTWALGGLAPFAGLSANRTEKWSSYCDTEKWIYHAVHLTNDTMRWKTDGLSSPFLGSFSEEIFHSDCYVQVTYILALANMWNKSPQNTTNMEVNLVAFASLEHVWFGYIKNQSNEDFFSPSVVHMSIDEAEQEHRLIVNRIETTAGYDDFACITYQNTITSKVDDSVHARALRKADFAALLWAVLFNNIVETYESALQRGEEPPQATEEQLCTMKKYVWNCFAALQKLTNDTILASHTTFLLSKLLVVDPVPPAPVHIRHANAFEALAAVLRLNPDNYLARQSLVELYLGIGENFLAHQHCLVLLEQLREQAEDSQDALVAIGAHSFAAELVDTGLNDVHQLHLRHDEGYDMLDLIPSVGDKIEVEWALDEELVRYTGTISLHPAGDKLCICYDDDTVPGQHCRRFESALHMVNINDPSDPYLERYYFDETGNNFAEVGQPEAETATPDV